MIKIEDPKDCCGCTACASICAHEAIKMEPDALGFLYPKTDISLCVECGLCEKVCQFNENYDRTLNLSEPIAYAARHRDIDEVMKSRSGAAFVAISDYILEQGGVIYGVGYKDHFLVAHKRATTKIERDEFRGSKYVQSDLTGVFRQVKEDLKSGLKVLFSGTPCQTSGLNAYVGKRLRENLILVDIICHGVPSPSIWLDYIAKIIQDNKRKIVKVDFRDKKRFGWKDHRESFILEDNSVIIKNNWATLFYKHIMFRHSCGVCHFTNFHRPSDITLADFWGSEKTTNINKDDKGLSLIFCNTEKGCQIFDQVKDIMEIVPADLNNITQKNLQYPTIIHPQRIEFEKTYAEEGFDGCMAFVERMNKKPNLVVRILRRVKRIINNL